MEIRIESLLGGAEHATGVVGIIDVFRAFSTAAVALANGASRIIMVSGVEEALALRDSGVGQLVMGEVEGRAPDGFDFGNSPLEASRTDVRGKTIIQRTSAGTRGITAAHPRSSSLRQTIGSSMQYGKTTTPSLTSSRAATSVCSLSG